MKKRIRLLALLMLCVILLGSSASAKISKEEIRNATSIGSFSDDGIAKITLDNGKTGFINNRGETVCDAKWDGVYSFSNGIAEVYMLAADGETKKYGAINSKGKSIVDTKWDALGWYDSVQKFVAGSGPKDELVYTVLNSKGKKAFSGEWDDISVSEGIFIMTKDGRVGCCDADGKEIIPFEYESIESFKDGMAVVCKDGKYGLIRADGSYVLEPQYKAMDRTDDQLWVKTSDGKYWRIDEDGNKIMDLSFAIDTINKLANTDIELSIYDPDFIQLDNGAMRADGIIVHYKKLGDRWVNTLFTSIIVKDNGVMLPFFDQGYMLGYCSSGVKDHIVTTLYPLMQINSYQVERDSDHRTEGVIDLEGNVIIRPGKYESIYTSGNDGYRIEQNGYWGLTDANGNVRISPYYDSLGSLAGGLMAAKKGSAWGYIDKNGNTVIPFRYEKANSFENGYAAVKASDGWYIIDTAGNIVY